jgi:hypothetical protein
MPRCKNYDGYYVGKEPSPRGIGYHAQGEAVGTERIGLDQQVWHVVEFGSKKTKRWAKGQTRTSRYVKMGHMLELEARELNIGLLYPNMDPYKSTSWSPYSFEVVDKNHVQIIKNDLGIPLRPMRTSDFVELYKKTHGICKIETQRERV